MLNKQYTDMLQEKDVIFEIFQYAAERAKVVGAENIYDFSLGNPSVPAPSIVNETIVQKVKSLDPLALHGYSPSFGIMETREKIAASLNKKYGSAYKASNIFMAIGAAGALAHALRAVTNPGDEIITFAPLFPEYFPYVNTSGAVLKVVPADTQAFQINFEEFEKMLNPNVAAILVNSPNNPSGTVYSEETLTRLADILRAKQKEYGHDIFIISDEPYREIVFDGKTCPYLSKFYDNTLSCYSFSKSLSLPGERIGYVAANPACTDADLIALMCGQISRGIGHNCPSSTVQQAVAEVIDEISDMSVYETNRNLLYWFPRMEIMSMKRHMVLFSVIIISI